MKEEKALIDIEEMLNACKNPFVAFSGGKDSTVLSFLVRRLLPDIPHVFYDYEGCNYPETEDFLNQLEKKGMNLIKHKMPSLVEVYKAAGGIFQHNSRSQLQQFRERMIARPWREVLEKYNFDASFVGLRANEAGGRLSLLQSRGKKYWHKKDKQWQFLPLGWWTAEQIWMYIDTHEIDYNKLYDKLIEFEGRENARVSTWTCAVKMESGTFSILKKTHLEIFNQIAAEIPEIRNYV